MKTPLHFDFSLFPGVIAFLLVPSLFAQSSDEEGLRFFEAKIRPVLVEKCYECHAADAEKVKGGLLLDTREGMLQGGESGPSVVPGDVEGSLLVEAIEWHSKEMQMPPKTKLPDNVIADFKTWIKRGAPDPRLEKKTVVEAESTPSKPDARSHWAFQPPVLPTVPPVKDEAWPRTPVDRFLLAKMEEKGLRPVKDADRSALIRRVYFDLTGLPPPLRKVEEFLRDTSPDAFEKVVDSLLGSPEFGVKWGRHWLDVARYGESSGKDVNILYPHAWRYRDYVVDSFNADKPYDEFLTEQLAGDLLPAKTDDERAAHWVATGFLAIGPKSHNEQNRLQFQMDLIDEQIDVVTRAMTGVTVACARCHDHKFDPVSQEEYYAMAGIFRSTETAFGTLGGLQNRHSAALLELPAHADVPVLDPEMDSSEREKILRQIETLEQQKEAMIAKAVNGLDRFVRTRIVDGMIANEQEKLASFDINGKAKAFAMGVLDRDRGTNSPLYKRGDVGEPGEEVPRGFVEVLSRHEQAPVITEGSGRLELAEWIASPEHPTTARVMVNRVWHHLFGRGIVASTDNFGLMGEKPTHPELLDFLAIQFVEQGWSVKKLIRSLVLSRTYQMSSSFAGVNAEIDPDNHFFWRATPRRLQAEEIRDSLLMVAGLLDRDKPVGSAVAQAGDGPVTVPFRKPIVEEAPVRSLYLPIVRDMVPEQLETFDFPDPSLLIGERESTNVPSQGLFMLNDVWIQEVSDAFADKITEGKGGQRDIINEAFKICFARVPTPEELAAAERFFSRFRATLKPSEREKRELPRSAWSAFCQGLLASSEFRYLR